MNTASSQSLGVKLTTRGDKIVNGNLTIECLVTAPPTASVELSKDGEMLIADDRVSIIQDVTGNIRRFDIMIERLRLSDSGVYRCQAQVGRSRSSSSVKLTVRDELYTKIAGVQSSSSSSSSHQSQQVHQAYPFTAAIQPIQQIRLNYLKKDK